MPFAQADPLLQIVGEAGPEHFHLHFGQAAQVELAQSEFALDPGVAELDHPAASTILFLRLRRRHLLTKGDHGSGLFCAQQTSSAMLIAGTALRLERTVLAVLGPRFVAIEKVSRLVFVPSFVAQMLGSGTNIVVVLGVVDEDGGRKASGAGVVFLHAALAQTADIVDPERGHGFDAAAIGKVCVGQHLPRLAAHALGNAPDCGCQLFAVIGGLRHFHVHDQRLRRIGRDLHVVVGRDVRRRTAASSALPVHSR